MEWHDCPDCKGKHPWRPGEKPCPRLKGGKTSSVRIAARPTASSSSIALGTAKTSPPELPFSACDVVARGRPRIGAATLPLSQRQPWLKLGMSRRTWYRRQKAINASRPSHDQRPKS